MRMKRVLAWVWLGILLALCGNALADEATSNVRFSVIRDYNGKPVRNASVVLHPVSKKGKQERSGLQLKTDAEGNTNFDGVPYGPLEFKFSPRVFKPMERTSTSVSLKPRSRLN